MESVVSMDSKEYIETVARHYHAASCKSFRGPVRNTFDVCPEPLCVEGRAQLEALHAVERMQRELTNIGP